GIDLVRAQLRIAGGETLAQIGIAASMPTRGVAIELRINMETIGPDGAIVPSGGTIAAYEPPSGPGIRVDGYGYGGYRPGPSYDSLLAKLIVHAPTHDDTLRRARRALDAFRIDGVATNIGFLAALLDRPEFARYDITTRFIDDHVAALATPVAAPRDGRGADDRADGRHRGRGRGFGARGPAGRGAGIDEDGACRRRAIRRRGAACRRRQRRSARRRPADPSSRAARAWRKRRCA